MAADNAIAAQALLIRRAVQPLLLRDLVDEAAWQRAAKAHAGAWKLFLQVERCALPLSRALASRPELLPPAGDIASLLVSVTRREFLRIVITRGHLRTAATVSLTRQVPIIVLKGAALAFDDPVSLVDVDLLLRDEQIPSFTGALPADQWERTVQSTALVAESVVAKGLAFELHTRVDGELDPGVWERSEPFSSAPPLRQLGPVDYLKHVTHHISVHHPHRRTRLRDLYVVRRAMERCSAETVTALWTGPDASYVERTQRRTLNAVVSPAQDDRREQEALTNYLIALRRPFPIGGRDVHEALTVWAVSMGHTSWERRYLWSEMRAISKVPSSRRYIRVFERFTPPIGRALRHLVRLGGLGLLTIWSWGVARQVQLRARQLHRRLPQ